MSFHKILYYNKRFVRTLLILVFSLLLAFWSLIFLDFFNYSIPLLRQIIGFFLFTFIPGILILRILNINQVGNIKIIIYSIGLSLSLLMFVGYILNRICPIFGIIHPISFWPLLITLSSIILSLCIYIYIRDRNSLSNIYFDFREIITPQVLVLTLLPFIAIIGTFFINIYQINIILIILLLIIAIIPVIFIYKEDIPENYYPYAIFLIALTLLYHRSLISSYIWGWDIHYEYFIINDVIQKGFWDSSIYGNVNAMLSVVILSPLYSILLNLSPTCVLKIIYPFIFALVPLGLYIIFKQQTNNKIALLACFFFISLFTFYTEMLFLCRQEIAEFFLVLIIIAIMERKIDKISQSLLLITFSISLVISHYGLSYIYLICLIFAWIVLVLNEKPIIKKMFNSLSLIFCNNKKRLTKNPFLLNNENRIIVLGYVIFIIIFALVWYIYNSSSSSFNSFVTIGDQITNNLFIDLFNPETAQGLNILIKEPISLFHAFTKYLHLLTIFFIIIGLITLLLKQDGMNFNKEYKAFAYVTAVICFAGIAAPYFSSALNTTRLYHITLIFLAPFCIIGGITLFKIFKNVIRKSWMDCNNKRSLQVLSGFFAVFLLFNSGFIYEIVKDNPFPLLNNTIDYPQFNDREVLSAKWLSATKTDASIYADAYRWLLVGSIRWNDVNYLPVDYKKISTNSYIYIGTYNLINNTVIISYQEKAIRRNFDINYDLIINDRDLIYSNGGARIYY